MISDVEAAHILIALSRSKPRDVVKPIEKEENNSLSVPVPRQKRSSSRVPRQMRRDFPMDPSSSSTALVAYVSQEDPSPPRIPPLRRKASSSTAIVAYVSQEEESPPTTPPPLSRKKRPRLFPPIEKQPKKKAKVADSSWTKEATPDWLLELVKGEDVPKRIIEKELSATDVSRGHNRLSMPCSNIIDSKFLSLAEQRFIDVDEGNKHKTGINAKLVVKFVNCDVLVRFDVNLRKWRMPKKSGSATFLYNLVTGWNKVVDDCRLHANDKIRLWSFYSEGELCFALALDTPPPPNHPPLLLPPPSDDTEDANTEEMSSALVIYDKSIGDLETK